MDLIAGARLTVRRKPVYDAYARQFTHHLAHSYAKRLPGEPLPLSGKELLIREFKQSQLRQNQGEGKLILDYGHIKSPERDKYLKRTRQYSWRHPNDLSKNEQNTLEQQRARILWSDPGKGQVQLGRMISDKDIVIDKELKTDSRFFVNDYNAGVFQKRPMKKLLSGIGKTDSLYLGKYDPIRPEQVLGMLPDRSFMTRKISDDITFQRNIERIRDRNASDRIRIFDFSPKSPKALQEMELVDKEMAGTSTEKKMLRQWVKLSDQIKKKAKPEQLVESKTKEEFFKALSEIDEGAVIILVGHSDGKSLWVDTGEERIQITKTDISKWLAAGTRLPTTILLSCQTREEFAPEILKAGSPLVFTSPDSLRVDQVNKFFNDYLSRVNSNKGVDAVDAIYDTLKVIQLDNFGPISLRHRRVLTMNA